MQSGADTRHDLVLRPATAADADQIAALFSASRRLLTFLPELHSVEEDRGYIIGHVIPECGVTVADRAGRILGFLAERPQWIEHLYVLPGQLRGGVGTALLDDVKERHVALELWCFFDNFAGRRFYEKHGFRIVEETDGSGNEARARDLRYRWERVAQLA